MVDQGTNGRPHSSNWRALHAEGILWDGQIYVAGAGVELPLRLIATSQRVAPTGAIGVWAFPTYVGERDGNGPRRAAECSRTCQNALAVYLTG